MSLFDLDLVHNVEEGEVLATRTVPTVGEPGINVRGEPTPSRPGKPARLRAGSGARVSDDGAQVLAAVAGHAVLVGNIINVSNVYHVHGDVGPGTGHLDFVGSVRIAGNVDRGYRVKAGGDVEIQGSMAGGEIEAGGNVSVRYGIQGRDSQGSVTALGTVRAKFIEFATVRAGGNVYASDGIVNSVVDAGAVVEVLGVHGSIIGGRVVTRELIKARELGSVRGVPTELLVGADPGLVAPAQQVQGTCYQSVRVSIGNAAHTVDTVWQRPLPAQPADANGRPAWRRVATRARRENSSGPLAPAAAVPFVSPRCAARQSADSGMPCNRRRSRLSSASRRAPSMRS